MKRIDTINARENMFGIGKSGFHDNADLPGQDATYVSPEWFNAVQEELCNLLELRGITLDPASNRQLYDLLTTQADLEALSDEIETNFIRKNQIADDLTTNDATKVASAKQVKILGDSLDILNYCPIAYPKSIPPTGYLAMMGQAISQATYPILYALYGATLPDLRGQFLRGLDYGKGVDASRIVLSEQEDAIRNITGTFPQAGSTTSTGVFFSTSTAALAKGSGTSYEYNGRITEFNASRVVPTASENRPKNIAFLYIVKAG